MNNYLGNRQHRRYRQRMNSLSELKSLLKRTENLYLSRLKPTSRLRQEYSIPGALITRLMI